MRAKAGQHDNSVGAGPLCFMRYESRHPETGLQCERLANTCWGLDHTAMKDLGERIFWPDPPPTNAMERYFRDFLVARRSVIQGTELEEQEIQKAVIWAIEDEPDEPGENKPE